MERGLAEWILNMKVCLGPALRCQALLANVSLFCRILACCPRLSRTILTLFMTISGQVRWVNPSWSFGWVNRRPCMLLRGGMLWNEALKPLSEISWIVDILFLMYIFSTAPRQRSQTCCWCRSWLQTFGSAMGHEVSNSNAECPERNELTGSRV